VCRCLGEWVIPTALVGGVARRTAAQNTPRTSLGRAWARKGYSTGTERVLLRVSSKVTPSGSSGRTRATRQALHGSAGTTGIWLVWYGTAYRVSAGYSRSTAWGTHRSVVCSARSRCGRAAQSKAAHRTTACAGSVRTGCLTERYVELLTGTYMGCSRHAYRVSAAVAAFRGRRGHGTAAQSRAHRSVVCLVWHYWVLTGSSRYRDRFGTQHCRVLIGTPQYSRSTSASQVGAGRWAVGASGSIAPGGNVYNGTR
jgi:hypothetical protein